MNGSAQDKLVQYKNNIETGQDTMFRKTISKTVLRLWEQKKEVKYIFSFSVPNNGPGEMAKEDDDG